MKRILLCLICFGPNFGQAQDGFSYAPVLHGDLLDVSNLKLREKIDTWRKLQNEQLKEIYLLDSMFVGNSEILALFDSILVHLKNQENFGPAIGRFKEQYDFDQNGTLEITDAYSAEIFNSRLKINRILALSPDDASAKILNTATVGPILKDSNDRYLFLAERKSNLEKKELLELQNLENFFQTLQHHQWLLSIENFIVRLGELELQFGNLFERNSFWKHRPPFAPHLIPQAFSPKDLISSIDTWVKQIQNGSLLLTENYPSLQNTQELKQSLQKTVLEIEEIRRLVVDLSSSKFFSDIFWVNPELHCRNFRFEFSPLENVELFEARFNDRSRAFLSYKSEKLIAFLKGGGGRMRIEPFLEADAEYLQNWTRILELLGAQSTEITWAKTSSVLNYIAHLKEFSTRNLFIPVQWVPSLDEKFLEFLAEDESVAWVVLEISEAEDWVAEFQTQFLKFRTNLLSQIAKEIGFDFTNADFQILKLNQAKKNLLQSLKFATHENSSRIELEIEEISKNINFWASKLTLVNNDPRIKALKPELLDQYANKKGWSSPHDPSRLQQIERYLGLSPAYIKALKFIRKTQDLSFLVKADLNHDGLVNSKDLLLKRISEELIQIRAKK